LSRKQSGSAALFVGDFGDLSGFLKAFSGGFSGVLLTGATNYSDVPGAPLRGAGRRWNGSEWNRF
jgi:hypothetical protein